MFLNRRLVRGSLWPTRSRITYGSINHSSTLTLGDVTLPVVHPAPRQDLVPRGYLKRFGDLDAPELVAHFRWMAQKHLLGQDMFLLSAPGPLTRHLVMAMAELANWEVEHLVLTKDTSEADIKQRREIKSGSVVFVDQAPVRAAMHGRLLVLDGIEMAERNVLPTLNNLLENREMALEDGRFLTRHVPAGPAGAVGGDHGLVQVHPNFRVVALGAPTPPFPGRPLDPPLRSRFQGRFVDDLAVATLLGCLDTAGVVKDDLQVPAWKRVS